MKNGLFKKNTAAVDMEKTCLTKTSEVMKEILAALRDSRAWLFTVLKSTGDAVIATDEKGRVQFLNPIAEGLTGWSQAEARGKLMSQIFRIFKDGDKKRVIDPIRRVMKYKKIIGLANHALLEKKDGTQIPIEDSAAPIRDEKGKIIGVVLVFRDATERRATQLALQRSESLHRGLIEHCPDGIALVDKTGALILVNSMLAKMVGRSVEEMIGRSFCDFTHPDSMDVAMRVYHDFFSNKKKLFRFEAMLKHKDGHRVEIEDYICGVHIDGQKMALIIVRDIAERKKSERALRESEMLYRALIETTNTGYVVIDQRGIVVDANKEYVQLAGYKKLADIRGRSVIEWTADYEKEKNTKAIARCVREGYVRNLEIDYVSRDKKSITPIEISATVVDWGGRKLMLSICRDIGERRLAEVALRESEKKYSTLVENAPSGILLLDKDGIILYENPMFAEIIGAPKGEHSVAIGRKIYTMQNVIEAGIADKLKGLLCGQPIKDIVFPFTSIYKKQSVLILSGIPLHDEKDRVSGAVLVVRDITEQKRMTRELEASRIMLDSIIEVNPYSIQINDADGHPLRVNQAFKNLFGSVPPPEYSTFSDPILAKFGLLDEIATLKNGKTVRVPLVPYNAHWFDPKFPDKLVYGRATFFPLMDAQGTLQNIVVMHEDVTAQKQLEDAQRLLSEKYGILVESSNDGIVILQDKLVKFFNKRMLELLDYGEKEVLNHPFVDFISDRYKQEVASQNDMRSDGSISGSRYEAELLAKDRRTIMVEVNASKIEYDGRPASMAVIRDISRYKEIDKMKSEFVSVVSHQLRTPLTGIKWFTELLGKNKQQNLTDEQKEYVAQIAEGNARMVRLVDDLLNVSRMEQSDKYVIEKQEVDVLSVISKVIRGELVFAQRRGIDIRLDRRCPSVKLVIDEEKLSQVFHNIINNAIKYSLSGAVVEIGCQVKKDEIVYFVKDSGVGIPKAQQRRIFEKFFRADNVASTESGTGLGLYISKFILERHGGRLWFESEQNKGTTFYIALPKK